MWPDRAKGLLASEKKIGPLHDPVTWYKIIYTGEQVAQWDFQNKGRCIVWDFPLCNLLTSICNFVPCDRVVQRAYWPYILFKTGALNGGTKPFSAAVPAEKQVL